MECYKGLVVLLALFLHRGNCRVITPLIEVDSILDGGNEEHVQQEKPAHPTGLAESDLLRHVRLQLSSEHASGEGSDDVIQYAESAPLWRHKRSPGDEPSCYTGNYMSYTLPNNGTISVPICKDVTADGVACSSSMANNNNQRKCVPSHFLAVAGVAFSTKCSCAP